MDFQDFAAKETTAAVGRALAESSEGYRQRLQAFRSAINAATKALESALASTPHVELNDLAARLAKTASAETESAVQRARTEADRSAADAKSALEAVRAQLKAETKDKDALAATLAETRAKADELRLENQTQKERIETARQEIAAAREAHKKAETARGEATAACDKEAKARAAAEAELQALRTALEQVRGEAAAASKALEGMRAEKARLEESISAAGSHAQASEAKLNAVTSLFKANAARVKTLERAEQEREAVVRDLEEKLGTARTLFDEKLAAIKALQDQLAAAGGEQSAAADRDGPALALMDDLLAGFSAFAGTATIADVLAALGKGLSKEFSRVALFRVKSNRLEGESSLGFDSKTDIAKVAVPLGMDSLLTRAVNSGTIARLTGSDLADTGNVPFGGTQTCALALPIVVDGETLGIVYADNSGAADKGTPAEHDLKTRFADALLQYGVALLTRLTGELRKLAELRTYAGSLLGEMEQMYLSDAQAGKAGPDLQARLRDNLEYARSIYANRIAIECPDAGTLLDEQLGALLESRGETAFGRDLRVAAGREAAAGQSRRTAS